MTVNRARPVLLAVLTIGICSWAATGTQAQTAAPDKAPPGSAQQNAPSQFDAQAGHSGSKDESLSDRLDRSNGVIKPPAHADSDIHVTPPPTGDNMAIPPSVSPAEKNAAPK